MGAWKVWSLSGHITGTLILFRRSVSGDGVDPLEKMPQLLCCAFRQGRARQRVGICKEMFDASRSRQNDMDARLIPAEAVRAVRDVDGGVIPVEQEADRISRLQRGGYGSGKRPLRRQILQKRVHGRKRFQRTAHREHIQHANILGLGCRKDPFPGRLIDKVKAHHHYIPEIVLNRSEQHMVLWVRPESLRDTGKTDRSRGPQVVESGNQFGAAVIVLGLPDPVQVENVDAVGLKPLQSRLNRLFDLVGGA